MDRDFDGRLSFGEFMGEETPLEKVFKSMDKDGDGTVTKEVRLEDEEENILVFSSFQEFSKICKHLTQQQVINYEYHNAGLN